MDEVLFGIFAENVSRYLDGAEGCTEEQRRMVAAWRALLDLHRPTGRRGGCAGCAQAHHRAMCTVWRVASGFFIRA